MNKALWWRYNSSMSLEWPNASSGRGYGCSHAENLFIHNYKAKIPQDTWYLKWSPVLCLPAKSRQLRGKDEAGAGHSLLTSMMSKSSLDHEALSACMPILSSYFLIPQVPRKHSWPLLTAITQSIPHYIVSKYLACPCFKTFDYIILVANAYSLMPAALSPPQLFTAASSTSAQPALEESSVFSSQTHSVFQMPAASGSHPSAWVTMHTWSNERCVKAGSSHADLASAMVKGWILLHLPPCKNRAELPIALPYPLGSSQRFNHNPTEW